MNTGEAIGARGTIAVIGDTATQATVGPCETRDAHTGVNTLTALTHPTRGTIAVAARRRAHALNTHKPTHTLTLKAGRSALTIETGEVGATEVTGVIVTIAVIVDVVAELAHRGATDTTRVHRPLLCAPITVVVYAIADLGEGLGRSITRELTSVTHGHTRATRAHIVATRLTYPCHVLVDEAIAVFVEVVTGLTGWGDAARALTP